MGHLDEEIAEIRDDVKMLKSVVYGHGADDASNSIIARLTKIEEQINKLGWAVWGVAGSIGAYVITYVLDKILK